MRKSKFTPEQILQALRQAESGTAVIDICRKMGVTETTFYRWRKQYAGLDVSELRELGFGHLRHGGLLSLPAAPPPPRRVRRREPARAPLEQ